MTLEEKKAIAQDLFLHTDKTQAEIARIIDVTDRTLTLWKKNGKWEEMRGALTATPMRILENLYQRLYEVSKNPYPDYKEIRELARAIETVKNKKSSVVELINSFKAFQKWLIANGHTDLAKQISPLQQSFVNAFIQGETA